MAQPYASLTQQMLQDFQHQRLESAERLAKIILGINPKDLVALQVQGLALAMQGRISESVAPLYKASQQDQKNPELLSNLAKAQQGANLYVDAIQTYRKLNRLTPNNPQILTDTGTAYAKSKLYDEAASCFNKALELQPNYFLAWSNQGNLLAEQSYAVEAIASYERALESNPNYVEAWTNLGNAFFDLGRYDEARNAHEKALTLDPDYAEAWSNHGNALLELKSPLAFDSYQKGFSLKPEHPYLIGQLCDAAAGNCDWSITEDLKPQMIDMVSKGLKASAPFIMLQTESSLEIQNHCAQIYAQDRMRQIKPSHAFPVRKELNRKIRLGYFSSDFKDHPVGILMENILRFHDSTCFEIYGFFLNKKTGDDQEKCLDDLFDHKFTLFGLNDYQASQLILEQELDIAVDLNGHTSGARMNLFSQKLASIQVNYLGYAGTSGTDFYDYLIADEMAIPPEYLKHFTEKIAYLPHSFFPVDTSIPIEKLGDLPSRESQGLPDQGFIFACFNNAYKITPHIFGLWMNILKNL